MAKHAQSERMQTPEGRASYAFVFTPRADDKGVEKYSMTLLIPKTSERGIAALKEAAKAVGIQEFGATFVDQVKAGRLRWPFRDGDKDFPDDPVYAGHMFLSMRNTEKPQIVDYKVEPITDPSQFGSGDYAKVSGRFFAYDSKGNKGVSFSLGNIQKVRSGERLDNRVDARKEFDALPDTEGSTTSSNTASTSDDFDL